MWLKTREKQKSLTTEETDRSIRVIKQQDTEG
jgi:hypothetical protein